MLESFVNRKPKLYLRVWWLGFDLRIGKRGYWWQRV